jgi:hypothetical protein
MYLAKWVLPAVLFGGVAVWVVADEARSTSPHYQSSAVALLILATIFVFILKKKMWVLADEVLDGGDHLLVRFGRRTTRISLNNLAAVDVVPNFGVVVLRLQLKASCDLGPAVSFLTNSTSRNPQIGATLAADLRSRLRNSA